MRKNVEISKERVLTVRTLENGGWFRLGDRILDTNYISTGFRIMKHSFRLINYRLSILFDQDWPLTAFIWYNWLLTTQISAISAKVLVSFSKLACEMIAGSVHFWLSWDIRCKIEDVFAYSLISVRSFLLCWWQVGFWFCPVLCELKSFKGLISLETRADAWLSHHFYFFPRVSFGCTLSNGLRCCIVILLKNLFELRVLGLLLISLLFPLHSETEVVGCFFDELLLV